MFTRRNLAPTLLAAGALLVVGCGDSRLDKMSLGISKDSVLSIMGRPERFDGYFANGQSIYAYYFAPPGVDSGLTPERKLTPVILIEGKVAAWGWDEWEVIAGKNDIVLKQ